MIYELRNYTAQPGRLRDLLARLKTIPIASGRGTASAKPAFDDYRGSDRRPELLVGLESFAEREQKWNALRADPNCSKPSPKAKKNGPLVFNVENLLLQPTSFSGSHDGWLRPAAVQPPPAKCLFRPQR